MMICDVCGEPGRKLHDGRVVCGEHKLVPTPAKIEEESQAQQALREVGKVAQLLQDTKQQVDQHNQQVEEHQRVLGELSQHTANQRIQLTQINQAIKAVGDLVETHRQVMATSSQVGEVVERLNQHETSLGSQQSLLGDFFDKAEATTKFTMIATELLALKSRLEQTEQALQEQQLANQSLKKSWWARVRWFLGY
jgi:uncharacterized Zn finger protein (UPF0148 family)